MFLVVKIKIQREDIVKSVFSLDFFAYKLSICTKTIEKSCAIGRSVQEDIDKSLFWNNNIITLIKHLIKDI